MLNKYSMMAVAVLIGTGATMGFATDAQSVLSDIHKTNLMEIRMGKLAQEKGSTADVRTFGATLVKDHQDADEKVKALADKQGISLEPSGKIVKAVHQHEMKSLADKSGADFDKAFVNEMVTGHQKNIEKLQKAEQTLAGSPTGDLIAKLLPTLQDHLDMAEKLSAATPS